MGRLADAFRDEPVGADGQPTDLGVTRTADIQATEAMPTERRAERSSGSTTIAGLLAEALAAYQENEPEPPVKPEPPAKKEPAPDNDFERLFDWRYQSPASGRHRSPE